MGYMTRVQVGLIVFSNRRMVTRFQGSDKKEFKLNEIRCCNPACIRVLSDLRENTSHARLHSCVGSCAILPVGLILIYLVVTLVMLIHALNTPKIIRKIIE